MWWLGYDFTILKQVETRVLSAHTFFSLLFFCFVTYVCKSINHGGDKDIYISRRIYMWNNKTDNIRCVVYFLCTSLLYKKKHVSMRINVLPQRCSSNNTTKNTHQDNSEKSCFNTLLHDTVSLCMSLQTSAT